MVRRGWAAAGVLPASVPLRLLFQGPAPDAGGAARAVTAAERATPPRAPGAGAEDTGTPARGEDDLPVHRTVAPASRTVKAAGSGRTVTRAPVGRPADAGPGTDRMVSVRSAYAPWAGVDPRGAALRTFRC